MGPSPDHYAYRVRWSAEDECFVGTVAEFPSLSWMADTQSAALDGIVEVVRDVLVDMANSGEVIPAPIADRAYSGKFVVRIPPEAHRELALEAAEEGVSLNLLIVSRLAAPASGSDRLSAMLGHGAHGDGD